MSRTFVAPGALALLPLLAAPIPSQALCDWTPNAREIILDTNFAQVATSCGVVTVVGGVFVFRNVHIPAGTIVRGVGTNPLIVIATGTFRIDGELWVKGGNGTRVDTLNSANFPAPGGRGVCGGFDGGDGSPESTRRSLTGATGKGPGGLLLGGQGGLLSCSSTCDRGSGGGGGSFATAGDPYYKLKSTGTSNVQQLGIGGFGCLNRTLPGGAAGPRPFTDPVPDNDFFGTGIDLFQRRLVQGELTAPMGGAGGGGGGDRALDCNPLSPAFINDNKGGGGGAGGGVVVVLGGGLTTVGPQGRICANGGNGGGGEQAGSNNQGGGGGGGAGGLVILASLTGVELWAKGETYANNDFDFVVSADGGAGTQGVFAGVEVRGKYPAPAPGVLDRTPIGGMGGLGIVQLITPFGSNSDGTNTIFDDNVHVVVGGVRATGATKQRFLAWRGWIDPVSGVAVDDRGVPTAIGDNEGDLRPAPILLPILQ
jgi:hypothetical protein